MMASLKTPRDDRYALRHTFASMASESHAETTGLAMLMGHSTTRTLMRYVRNTFSHHLKTVTDVGRRVELLGNGGGQNAKSIQILSPATKSGNGEKEIVEKSVVVSGSKPSS
ncbi:MAG: hypothetical protein WCO42_06240 [bacterium]